MNSLVAGSTGLVGSLVIKELLESSSRVNAICRNKLPSNHEALTYHDINFDDKSTYQNLFEGVSDAFICLGSTIKKAGSQEAFRKIDVDYCFNIACVASEAKVPHLSIVTSVGADPNSKNFYLRCKGEIEDKISQLNFESLAIYRPGLLIGKRQDRRVAEAIGQVFQPILIDPFLRGSASKFRSVRASDLAKSLVKNSGRNQGKKIFHFEDFVGL